MSGKIAINKGTIFVTILFLVGLGILLLSQSNSTSKNEDTDDNIDAFPSTIEQNNTGNVPPSSPPDGLGGVPTGLPVSKEHPLVQRVLDYGGGNIRYLFSGVVKSYRTTEDALEVTYTDSSGTVPEGLRITSATQISSYAEEDYRPLTYAGLQSLMRQNLKIELAVDYSMNTKTWSLVKEAYVPEKQ